MPWWHNLLKGLLPENIKLADDIDIKLLNNISIGKKVTIDNRQITLINADPKLIAKLLQAAPEGMSEGSLLFQEESVKALDQVVSTLGRADIEREVTAFREIIPLSDVPILEAAIVIKYLFENGQTVERQKTDVVVRYGARGNMICNLYSAGYFHSLILPASRADIDNFPAVYEQIVTESPLAVFVGHASTEEKIVSELARKMALNKEAGNHYLRIHGIGQTNRRRINGALRNTEILEQMTDDPLKEMDGSVVKVTIYF
jgi:hypothetical protein